jgi:hypothetical protein
MRVCLKSERVSILAEGASIPAAAALRLAVVAVLAA